MILSPTYLDAVGALPEWIEAFWQYPRNGPDFIIGLHVRECRDLLNKILGSVEYTNFVGLNEEAAREALLTRISIVLAPAPRSTFEQRSVTARPRFPDTPLPVSKLDKCPFCSSETRPGDGFCLNCGNRLVPSLSSPLQVQSAFEATIPAQDDWAASSKPQLTFTPSDKAVEVFFSYAHKDEAYRNELEKHLSLLRRQGLITAWHDRHILPGTDWAQAIDEHLEGASVILLLISADFLASDYCYGLEMQRALRRHQTNEARVIPILLRPVDWNNSPFAHLQALPNDAKPITAWHNRDEAFTDVAAGIRRVIEEFINRSTVKAEMPQETEIPRIEEGDTHANKKIARAKLLWVDDQPENNIYPRSAKEAVDIQITLSKSTEDALEKVHSHTYDIIISDMGRQPLNPQAPYDNRAGFTLLDKLRDQHIFTPFIIYAGSSSAEHQAETKRHGGFGTTNNPQMLLQMVIDAIEQSIDRSSSEFEAPQKTEELWKETGDAHANAGRYLEALEAYNRALELNADSVDIYNSRGFVYLQLGQYQQAIEEYDHAIELYPANAAAYSNRGFTYFRLTAYQQAIADYEHAVTLNPNDAEVYMRYGDALYSLRDFTSASEKYEQAIRLDPNNPSSYLNKGMALATSSRYIEALVSIEQTIRLDPTYTAAYLQKGNLLFSLERYQEAMFAYMKALQLVREVGDVKEEGSILSSLGTVYNTLGKLEEALQYYQQALKLTREVGNRLEEGVNLYNLALLFSQRHQYEQAEVLYKEALVIQEEMLGLEHPNTTITFINLGHLYFTQGKYEQAESLYQRALKTYEQVLGSEHPDTLNTVNFLALLYRNLGKYEQAESLYLRALEAKERVLGPENPSTLNTVNNLALLYREQGKYDEAEPLYQRALAICEQQLGDMHLDTANSLNNLANLYETQGKYDEAEPLYVRALAIREQQLGPTHPHTLIVQRNYGALLRTMGRDAEAGAIETKHIPQS